MEYLNNLKSLVGLGALETVTGGFFNDSVVTGAGCGILALSVLGTLCSSPEADQFEDLRNEFERRERLYRNIK